MVFTTDTHYGWGRINLNTSWAEIYIHDVWRMELKPKGEYKPDDLYVLYGMIEGKMNKYITKIIEEEERFDTYDLFEAMIENELIALLAERTHNKVVDELEQVGWLPQTRIGECEGCKKICEECERLVIVKE
jgi:hypothetical protein